MDQQRPYYRLPSEREDAPLSSFQSAAAVCTCNSTSLQSSSVIYSTGDAVTVEEVLQQHESVTAVLGKLATCKHCCSDCFTILDTLKTVDHLLSMFQAAQVAFGNPFAPSATSLYPPNYNQTPAISHATEAVSHTCQKSRVCYGRLTLDEAESTLVVKKIIRESLSKLYALVKSFQRRIWEEGKSQRYGQSREARDKLDELDFRFFRFGIELLRGHESTWHAGDGGTGQGYLKGTRRIVVLLVSPPLSRG
ncbi:hypothetical protein VTL71DRAFT_9535 [Oculimacula yallundae]|uniref:Uncharacterized protein n=1 Tax=Oculimacula yallundae TaxID=86028 RepID=A0ABR4BS80_9HELO